MLREAFAHFKEHATQLGARCFVLCTARSAANASLQKALKQLRADSADYRIDVYDEHRLADVLRTAPDLVFQFFGPGVLRKMHRLQHFVDFLFRQLGLEEVHGDTS